MSATPSTLARSPHTLRALGRALLASRFPPSRWGEVAALWTDGREPVVYARGDLAAYFEREGLEDLARQIRAARGTTLVVVADSGELAGVGLVPFSATAAVRALRAAKR